MIEIRTLSLADLGSADFGLKRGDVVFLHGDLWAGKTTFVQKAIRRLLPQDPGAQGVKSPTYVYYRKYGADFYHFDLYRLNDYDAFVNIGAEEIFEIPGATVFVEWPEMLEGRFKPTVRIRIEKTEADEMRRFEIERLSEPRIFS